MRQKIVIHILAILAMALSVTPVSAQEADSLNHYLEIAARNNPGVNAAFLEYKASLQKVPQAGAYPDPELEIGFFLTPMDIVGGRQIADFNVMQMFPWFGTKKAAQTEATHMAKMAYEAFRETRDNLYLEVYTQWYALCTLKQQLMNNHENKKLLEQLEDLAVRRFSSPLKNSSSGYSLPAPAPVMQSGTTSSSGGGMAGMGSAGGSSNASSSASPSGMSSMGSSGSGMSSGMGGSGSGMSDVLRIQLEIVEIENNIESIQSEIKAEKARFNALLNRPVDSEVVIPSSFEKTLFLFDEVTAVNRIEKQNPMLGMINEEGLAYKAKGEMDKKMSYPMIGIGLQYMLIGKSASSSMNEGMDNGVSSMNGMDMIMPMVSISLPLYRSKYKAQQRESQFLRQSTQEKYINTLNNLQSDLYKLKHQLDNAERKIALYKKQEELARTTYNLVVQEFVSAKSDLSDVIQVQRQLLDYQLREAEAVANYNTMVASINKLISFKED
jgi:Outer membrane protein